MPADLAEFIRLYVAAPQPKPQPKPTGHIPWKPSYKGEEPPF